MSAYRSYEQADAEEAIQLALLDAEVEQAACEVSALAKSVRELERVIDRRLAKRKARANIGLTGGTSGRGGVGNEKRRAE